MTRLAVTGANGYVGSRVCDRLAGDGYDVVALARAAPADCELVRWSLADVPRPALFREHRIDALVHCAYDFSPVAWPDIERINVAGSARLIEAARAAGVRTIVISTISAFPGCRSLYGRAKLAIEEAAAAANATTIRPCLVWGDKPGGMFGALRERARNSGVIPLIGPGEFVQYLVHEDDLCATVERCVRGEIRETVPITAGAERPWTFRKLIARMAADVGNKPFFVPVPWRATWAGLKVAESLGLRLGFRSDSVISLVYQNPQPDFSVARRLGLRFRDFDHSVEPMLASPGTPGA